MITDILIVGCGVAGLYCALNLPKDKKITVVQQQINVIQNGEKNFNLTNNGTMNFNF